MRNGPPGPLGSPYRGDRLPSASIPGHGAVVAYGTGKRHNGRTATQYCFAPPAPFHGLRSRGQGLKIASR